MQFFLSKNWGVRPAFVIEWPLNFKQERCFASPKDLTFTVIVKLSIA